ncbi:HD domain-containing protein [Paraburkholderia kirstenboschensis]|uniref:HD domain-containing protein n=2 Tax=Paraburkholderia kirstenboschensis TaxID=1245436 RepID=A0ABZ0EBL3_9BURK|nr:HD domain-containing protein [Paraburkholderia kirstenboschensis]WOD13869.1 HD domain-containing protein [Paraburkholderia kirstenboschensis]
MCKCARGQFRCIERTLKPQHKRQTWLARKAAALAGQAHSGPLLNHVHRTWWFAEFIGRKRQMKYDRELVYLASLLHDLGLSENHAAERSIPTTRTGSTQRHARWPRESGRVRAWSM